MITTYNGKEFAFDIYNDKYVSVTPRFNEDGVHNEHILLHEHKVFYRKTDEFNGTTIELEIKNPIKNKKEYFSAVKDQLTYFEGVEFEEYTQTQEDGEEKLSSVIDFKPKILYQNSRVIIPDSGNYAKAHLVLRGVNYGPINFGEFELEEKNINIAIIGDPNELDITPDRESIIYSARSRDAIVKYMKEAGDLALDVVDEVVDKNTTDLYSTLEFINNSNSDKGLVVADRLAKLAGLTDSRRAKIHGIRYAVSTIKSAMDSMDVYLSDSKGAVQSKRTLQGCADLTSYFFVFTHDLERMGKLKARYLKSIHSDKTVVEIRANRPKEKSASCQHALLKELLEQENCVSLSDVVIPEDWAAKEKEKLKKEEEAVAEEEKLKSMTPAEKRALEGKIVLQRYTRVSNGTAGAEGQLEMRAINAIEKDCVLTTREEAVHLLYVVSSEDVVEFVNIYINGDERTIPLYLVSKQVYKQLLSAPGTKCMSIVDVVRGTTTTKTKIVMNTHIKKTTLSLLATDILPLHQFLKLFSEVDSDAYDAYIELDNAGVFESKEIPDAIAQYFRKAASFQLDLKSDKKKLSQSKEVFGGDLDEVNVIDYPTYVKVEALAICVTKIATLLSMIPANTQMDMDRVEAVKEFLNLSGYVPYIKCLETTKLKYND